MKYNKLTPNFQVRNVAETVRFYTEHLGFLLVAAVDSASNEVDNELKEGKVYAFAIMVRDGVEIMLQESESFAHDVEISSIDTIGASVSFYIEIEGIDELYNNLKGIASEITFLKTTWYGAKEFYVKDNNNYILGFSEKQHEK